MHRDAIVEVALAMKELNAYGVTPHFHGVVMDERPMLVSSWLEVRSVSAKTAGLPDVCPSMQLHSALPAGSKGMSLRSHTLTHAAMTG